MDAEIPSFAQVLGELAASLEGQVETGVAIGDRYPVVRSGDRDEIPRVLRWLIWHRDRGRCQMCGVGDQEMQLDHIVPWSAGGSDEGRNLRLLCGPCNTTRSNYRGLEFSPVSPVTAICDQCIDGHRDFGESHEGYMYCPFCTGQRVTDTRWPGAERFTAFCGSCKRHSLVADERRLM